ncbi:MAG: hypothetical protein ACYDIC_02825 [Desulfobaccales bacterium]
MSFERFTQTGQRFKPKLSIWGKGGQIGFNKGAMNRFSFDNFRYAILFFDRENRRLGIKFTNDEKEEGIIKFNPRKTGAVIAGKAFLEYYNIDYSKTKTYDVVFDQENDLYIVNLE